METSQCTLALRVVNMCNDKLGQFYEKHIFTRIHYYVALLRSIKRLLELSPIYSTVMTLTHGSMIT